METQSVNVKSAVESSDILRRISEGDHGAVGDCLDKYGRLVWSLARRFTKNQDDAEDAVQEIFIDVWKHADRFDAAKSPEGAFVTLIARRRLIDRFRKSRGEPNASLFETSLTTRASDAHKRMQFKVEMEFIVRALDKLGDGEKRIMRMSIYGGMTHSEIAETIGLPLGTVKSQIRRGFQKIRVSVGSTAAPAAF